MYNYYNEDYLMHYGVKGMKWGVRRYKNQITSNGRSSIKSRALAGAYAATGNKRIGKALDKSNARDAERNTPEAKAARRKEAVKIGAAVAGTALASYGVYKASQAIKDKNFKHHMDQGMKSLDKLATKGRFDDGMEELKDIMNTQYNAKVSDIVKRTIDNNSVNGKVDWKAIRDMYK